MMNFQAFYDCEDFFKVFIINVIVILLYCCIISCEFETEINYWKKRIAHYLYLSAFESIGKKSGPIRRNLLSD